MRQIFFVLEILGLASLIIESWFVIFSIRFLDLAMFNFIYFIILLKEYLTFWLTCDLNWKCIKKLILSILAFFNKVWENVIKYSYKLLIKKKNLLSEQLKILPKIESAKKFPSTKICKNMNFIRSFLSPSPE